jgi:murein DD-endopeptidase MepM/ murein hydrolase activator NlpD
MVIPTTGYVATLFADTPYPESWYPSYWDPLNILQPRPAAGAHSGVDISDGFVDCQYPVYTAASGTVVWTGFDTGGFGWTVVVSHGFGVGNNGHYTYTVYAHMGTSGTSSSSSASCLAVQPGQNVTAGATVVGYQGSSGNATGTHVHWMILAGPTAPTLITSPYVPGEYPASADFYTCLALTQGDPNALLNQHVSAGQATCPAQTPFPPRSYLPAIVQGAAPGW